MVLHLYVETEESIMMGSFIFHDIEEPAPEVNTSKEEAIESDSTDHPSQIMQH